MINAKDVNEIFLDCLYKDEETKKGEVPEGAIIVEGIIMKVGFNPERVEKNKNNIINILEQLHPTFNEGWTFLNMCIDKNDNEWTGSHKTMEQLLVLGLAIGKLEYCCDRDMWSILPGGMPYVIKR